MANEPAVGKDDSKNPKRLTAEDVRQAERAALCLSATDPLYAICLSGGGIRSAAFCLGVIQAFAKSWILKDFHYLSTVSGGGYTGGWLTRLTEEQRGPDTETSESIAAGKDSVAVAERILANAGAAPSHPEAPELSNLRRYTNYLTPNPGFASADSWAGLILYLRNTVINWAIFLPLALAGAAIPVFCLNAVCWATLYNAREAALWRFELIFCVLALAALLVAVTGTCLSLPSHTRSIKHLNKYGVSAGIVDWRIIFFTMIWVFLAPFVAAPLLAPVQPDLLQKIFCPAAPAMPPAAQAATASPPAIPTAVARNIPLAGSYIGKPTFLPKLLPLAAFATCILAYLLATSLVAIRYLLRGEPWWPHVRAFLLNLPSWTVSAAISTTMLWLGAHLVRHCSVLWIALAGPLWVLAAEILRSTVYVALRSNGLYSDLDREWLARLSGDKLRWVLFISVLGATAVWVPIFVSHFNNGLVGAVTALIGIASGPTAAWFAKAASSVFRYGEGSGSNASNGRARRKYLVLAAAALFGFTIFALAGKIIVCVTSALYPDFIGFFQYITFGMLGSGEQLDFGVCGGTVFLSFLFLMGLAFSVDRFVNLNRFSMHAVYRNRLIRAFLGSARDHGTRRPDPYTQFDPDDNVRISKTWTERGRKRLFHVINVSLNYTTGTDTARAERKAQPFTISPLHCGGPVLRKGEAEGDGAYVETKICASGEKETGPEDMPDGITLGTAMAISGAAASPNMGYNSSPPAAFLMTLFNVRLGAWLPNPGYRTLSQGLLQQAGPKHAIPTLRRELVGQSDDRGQYVYLSDGGHFDNLGLYEMLRRRCALIVVVDAGADKDYAFFDLGHTLNMARIDLGVMVTFTPELKTGADPKRNPLAIAQIKYLDGTTGRLILLKPCRHEDIPIQLAAYAAINPVFPHETTLDQFFTESDFECYRQLGELTATDMLQSIDKSNALQNLRFAPL